MTTAPRSSDDAWDASAQSAEGAALASVADRLTASILGDVRTRHLSTAYLPDRDAVIRIVERLRWLMFPGFFGPRDLEESAIRAHVEGLLGEIAALLHEQVSGALRYAEHVERESPDFGSRCADCDARAAQTVRTFLSRLPEIRRLLSLDIQAAHDGDPASHHTDEIIFCYPGVYALTVHRLAHVLYRLNVPLVPRIMHEYAHAETGIDLHPGARIGQSFFIDHGTGVVVGETTVIGDHCKLYQGVTLGAASFPKDEQGRLRRGVKRHPTLEDHVTVYAGSTILGGDTIIGAGTVVNGGVFLAKSVPPGSVVRAPKADLRVRSNPETPAGGYDI